MKIAVNIFEVNRKRFHDDYFSLLGQLEAGFVDKAWADAFFVSGSYSKIDKEIQTGSIQTKVIGNAERHSDAWNVSARYQKRFEKSIRAHRFPIPGTRRLPSILLIVSMTGTVILLPHPETSLMAADVLCVITTVQ